MPRIDPPDTVGAGLAELASVVAVSEPVVVAGRTTFARETQDGTTRHEVSNWVTVAVMLDVKAQMAAQQRAYGATRKNLIFGPVEMQRRMRRDDGSWSDDDWSDVACSPTGPTPSRPAFQLIETSEGIMVSRERQQYVERFLKDLSDSSTQLEIMRPLMSERVNGGKWDVPVITSRREVLEQDDQFLFPNEQPSANPQDRYKPFDEDAGVRAGGQVGVVSVAAQLQEIDAQMKRAWETKSSNEATRAYNSLLELTMRGRTATAAERTRIERMMKDAEQMVRDINRWVASGAGANAVAVDDAEEDQVASRPPFPTQELWAHDAAPGSVESGRAYQYRVRPTIANRLLGQPEKLREPADALTAFIPGSWSAPVEVSVPVDTEFYITSKNERNAEIGVEFFKWFDGEWVRPKGRFNLKVGAPVEGLKRTDAPSSLDPTVLDQPMVSYSANATVLDIDFQRPYRTRKPGTTREGVRFDDPEPGCAVVMVDADGRLFERIVETDKADPRMKTVRGRVWTAPKKRP